MAATVVKRAVGRKAENSPIRVWMVDVPGGFVDVTDKYLWIKWPHSRGRMEYRVDGKKLYESLHSLGSRQTVGQLDFWELKVNGERLVVIEPAEDEEFLFQFELNWVEFKESLYYFVN